MHFESHAKLPPPQCQKTILLSASNSKVPGHSSLSPRPIFYQSQANLLSVLSLSSLSPRSASPRPRPTGPQFQVYLPPVPALSSRNFGPIFQAYLFPVPTYFSPVLSSLSSRPILPQSQPIFPRSQPCLLAFSGLSSRLIFPQFQAILHQSQCCPPSAPGLSSPGPRPIFPQSQVYRPSVPDLSFLSFRPISSQSPSSFASQLSPNLPATGDDGRCDLL